MLRRLSSLRASALHPTRRHFSSAYRGEMSDVLRFDCIYPSAHTVAPSDLRGRVVLVVNTASHCAGASQLAALQQLHESYHSRGLEIIAVPSNDFERKEPGSDEEIKMVYTSPDGPHRVAFRIARKSPVIGEHAHAFFAHIATKYDRSVAPTWNFDKFVVDPFGDLCAVFPHDTTPLEPEVHAAIEEALEGVWTGSDEELLDSDDDEEEEEGDEEEDDDEADSDDDEEEEDDNEHKAPPPQRRH